MPAGRFLLAFDDPMLTWSPTWTRLDSHDNLVTSYTIDRGRQYELDRTDTGRAVVSIADTDGILDPTNSFGPYYGKIEPLLQALVQRKNPVDGLWYTRYRGFIEDLDYGFDPSQQVNRLELSLIDIFEILSSIEMLPGEFGDTPPASADGQVFFDNANVHTRIDQVLADAIGLAAADYSVVFSGNVLLYETVYSPAESAMTAIAEAADAEFPGVSNVYTDRLGRLCFHGRLAKFDPVGTAASAGTANWDFHQWKAGDGAAVNGDPTHVAQIREFAFNRGLSKVINQGLATPLNVADSAVAGQLVQDTVSIGLRGIRSWSAQNLLTKESLADSSTALEETKRFATYYVSNYAEPRNRVTAIGFRSIRPGATGATKTWELLSKIDIADTVAVTVASPGGGGFNLEPYFVEGVHEEVRPLNPDYDDVTLRLDLSPQAYFSDDPWSGPHL